MFGFIFGTACLAGLFYTLRRGRWHHHGGRGGRSSWRGRMRWLFERLDTSPGQEKVLVQAADDLTESFEKLRDEMSAARAAMARSLRGESFDAAALRAVGNWAFQPATVGGRAVEAWVEVPVRFRLN